MRDSPLTPEGLRLGERAFLLPCRLPRRSGPDLIFRHHPCLPGVNRFRWKVKSIQHWTKSLAILRWNSASCFNSAHPTFRENLDGDDDQIQRRPRRALAHQSPASRNPQRRHGSPTSGVPCVVRPYRDTSTSVSARPDRTSGVAVRMEARVGSSYGPSSPGVGRLVDRPLADVKLRPCGPVPASFATTSRGGSRP